jgi:DNA-directed RNA polymerase subunit M/transcription elongation factor TFIIS
MLLSCGGALRSVEGEVSGALRNRMVRLVTAALEPVAHLLVPPQPEEYAAQLERVALVLADRNAETYMTTMSRVIHNLNTDGAVVITACPLSTVPNVSHMRRDNHSSAGDAALQAQVKSLLDDAAAGAATASTTAANVTVTDAITCPNCKSQDRIVRALRQSRAADEGMATQCLCMACNRSWRLS